MATHGAGEFPVNPEASLRPLAGFELAAHARDEVADVVGGAGVIHPGKPVAQILAPAIHRGIDGFGVVKLEELDFDPRSRASAKHWPIATGSRRRLQHADYAPPGVCGLIDFEIEGVSWVSGTRA